MKKNYVKRLGIWALCATMLMGNGTMLQAKASEATDSAVVPEILEEAADAVVEETEEVEVLTAGKDLIIPEGTKVIEERAFYNMKFTGKLVIPEGVTEIGDSAFSYCGFSGELVLPSTLKKIGEEAFYNCGFTGNLIIPENVEEIGRSAFSLRWDADIPETVILNEKVKIDSSAFSNAFKDIYFVGTEQDLSEYAIASRFYDGTNVHAPMNSAVRKHISSLGYGGTYVQWESINDIDEFTLNADELVLKEGDSEKVKVATIKPFIASPDNLKWMSSDITVATVDKGKIKAVGLGTATIEVYSSTGASQKCQVTVKKQFPFEDVNKSSWEYAGIAYVYKNNVMSGTTETTFKPAEMLTRSQFVTVLYNYHGKPAVAYKNRFTDVPDGEWFSKPIVWAGNEGITAGVGNGRFGVSEQISREQFVTMLYSYAKSNGKVSGTPSGSLSSYPDASKVSSWAKEAVLWAVNNDIITGKPVDGKLYISPQGTATRAECATIMMKYDKKYGN